MCFLRFFRKLAPGGIDEAHTKPLYYFRKQMRPDAASGKPPERLSGKTFCCDDFPDTAKRETLCTAFCSWQEQSSCVPGEQFLLSIGRRLARRAVRNFFIPSSAPASPALSEKPYVLPHTGQASVRAGLRYFSAIPNEIRNFGTIR